MNQYFDIHLFDIAGTPITLATIVTFGLVLIATIILSKVLEAATVRAFRLRKITDEGTVGVARRLVHYLVLMLGLSTGLQMIGINLAGLFTAGALFAVAIGFAMQNIVQNFVSGVILLVERTIKPGDILRVDGQLVKVSKMGIRATVARTLDDEEIIIPNSMLVQNPVKNFTLGDHLYRLRVTVGVVYSSDMAKVRETLETAAAEVNWRVQTRQPRVLLLEFGSSSVDFEVSVWIDKPWRGQRYRSELHELLWSALKKAEITIAFPQLDVHFDPQVHTSLEGLARTA